MRPQHDLSTKLSRVSLPLVNSHHLIVCIVLLFSEQRNGESQRNRGQERWIIVYLNRAEEGDVTGVEGSVDERHPRAKSILVETSSSDLHAQFVHALGEFGCGLVGVLVEVAQ